MNFRPSRHLLTGFILAATVAISAHAQQPAWPPKLPGANQNGTVTFSSKQLLEVPTSVAEQRGIEGVVDFDVAKQPPTIDIAYHGRLGENAAARRLWSSWGDIGVATDGSVYVASADHGNAVGGDARCFIYRWHPNTKVLQQIVDMNKLVKPQAGQPAWSKVHARIDEGPDGKIYFSCTLNDGNRGVLPDYHWTERLPGGQIYQYDPKTDKTVVFANLPAKRCTATSILDRKRGIWWCNLEGGGNALWALDLKTKQVAFKAPDGSMAFNRNFALADDGSIYFNGEGGIWKYDAASGSLAATGATFPDGSPGMRASTRQTKDGVIYGATYRTSQLFRFLPAKGKVELLGPTWLKGEYTTVAVLSPDEKFVYYVPGAHGKARLYGTPVIQYNITTGRRKVLAFLAGTFEKEFGYVPGGTYGVKLNADGSTLYINMNGHAATNRPEHLKPIGFGLCSFVAVHIPAAER